MVGGVWYIWDMDVDGPRDKMAKVLEFVKQDVNKHIVEELESY